MQQGLKRGQIGSGDQPLSLSCQGGRPRYKLCNHPLSESSVEVFVFYRGDRTCVFTVGSNLLRLPARSPTDWTISRITRPERGPEGGKSRRGRLWHNFQDCCFEFGRPSPSDQFLHAASFFREFSPQTKSYGLAQIPPTVFFDRGGLQFYPEIRTGPWPFLGG